MDRPLIAERLKRLLESIVEDRGSRVDWTADFADLGINSVDLIEFVVGVEKEFGVRVLDDLLPEEVPSTLTGWTAFLQGRLAQVPHSS